MLMRAERGSLNVGATVGVNAEVATIAAAKSFVF